MRVATREDLTSVLRTRPRLFADVSRSLNEAVLLSVCAAVHARVNSKGAVQLRESINQRQLYLFFYPRAAAFFAERSAAPTFAL